MGSDDTQKYPWFASIGTGYSWTQLPGIVNPNKAEWDPSFNGYDSELGNRGFYTFAIGKHIYQYIDLSLSYLNNETFNYQLHQTGSEDNTAIHAGRERTRYFNLNNRAVLANVFLRPEKNYFTVSSLGFSPFISAGIGFSQNQMTNFKTYGQVKTPTAVVAPPTDIGNPVSQITFSWQGSVGINVNRLESPLSVDLGYRYYDGGRFKSPTIIYTNTGGFLTVSPWSGQLLANQLFVEFKYTT